MLLFHPFMQVVFLAGFFLVFVSVGVTWSCVFSGEIKRFFFGGNLVIVLMDSCLKIFFLVWIEFWWSSSFEGNMRISVILKWLKSPILWRYLRMRPTQPCNHRKYLNSSKRSYKFPISPRQFCLFILLGCLQQTNKIVKQYTKLNRKYHAISLQPKFIFRASYKNIKQTERKSIISSKHKKHTKGLWHKTNILSFILKLLKK